MELLAALEFFVTATLLPTVAASLGGRAWYAAALAASAATVFVTMPVAGPLVDRFGPARMVAAIAPVYVAGAVLSAAAPVMWVHVLGRGISGLASGALATVGLGAVGSRLPAAWRTRVFAMTAGMWVVPALVGPAYAAALAGLAGWRWAYASLVPLVLAARVAVVRALRAVEDETGEPDEEPTAVDGSRRPLRVPAALALAGCMAVVALAGRGGAVGALVGVAGAGAALAVSRRLLLPGSLSLRPGRAAAIGALLLLSAAYFSVNAVIAIVAREAFGASRLGGGLTLSAGAFAWAVASLVRARRGATAAPTVAPGAVVLTAGLAAMAVAVAVTALPLLVAGWLAAGAGMGLAYPALLERAFGEDADGALGAGAIAASAVLAEALGGSLGSVGAGAAVTAAVHHPASAPAILAALFAGSAALALTLRAAAPRIRAAPSPAA